jgi:ribonuclease HII
LKKIVDIKSELDMLLSHKPLDYSQLNAFIQNYGADERTGVQQQLSKLRKAEERQKTELLRIQTMLHYENGYSETELVGGVDEAGRGPLAGPVVAACVILERNDPILYVDDSKKLTAALREELYEQIIQRAIAFGIGVVHEMDIDEMNILNATYKAMRIAISSMTIKPTQLLNDAVIIPEVAIPQVKLIHGDAKSLSIAAASILAKVSRDRIMTAYDELYPEYGFIRHKGYGSAEHIKAIQHYGPCAIHRHTFIKNFI